MKINIINRAFVIIAFIGLLGCEQNMDDANVISDLKHFNEDIIVENIYKKYAIGDTIWFSANISDKLTDSKSNEVISLENQTFILRGTINLLKSKYDTLPFIYENFDIVEDLGSIQLMNIGNLNHKSFTFDIRFGRPLITNELRFGLVLNYLAIFAIEYDCWVFYGKERINYDDFSEDNSKGYLGFSFPTEAINDSIFYTLPIANQDYFQYHYTKRDIESRRFCFFEVD